MEIIEETLIFVGKVLLFAVLSIIFLPCFLVVNFLQETWSKMLSDLF
jgi:flagellar biosynthesis protein FliQ